MSSPPRPTRPRPLGRREPWIALVLALAVFAVPVAGGLFQPDRVAFGVDTASSQLPWSAVVPEVAEARPRNPALADQGQVFYPYYLWVARSWLAGDVPAWNPDVYAGAPGIANPQSGALDPQVAPLVALYALGGRGAFDWGLTLLAWWRLAAAGLGAYLLARALGLLRGPSALAGLAFGLSGYVVLWLNFSLGHVAPLLPWVLLGLERIRGPRPWLAIAGTALAMALAILGGHPETAFYVGALAGVWALVRLREERRAGLLGLLALALGTTLAAASLIPFVEYLSLSGAKSIRDAALAPSGVDLVALGAVVLGAGLALWCGRVQDAAAGPERLSRHGLLAGLGFALALGGLILHLGQRGLAPHAAVLVLPGLFGTPGDGGYRGEGVYPEVASGWMALAVLGLALAAALSPRGPLRHRRWITPAAVISLLLCLEAPGVLDLYRHLPLVGLGATARLGSVSALLLALLAAEALQSAPRAARATAALTLALLGGGALLDGGPPPAEGLGPAQVQEDELFGLTLVPPAELSAETLRLEGWLHPDLAVEGGAVTAQKLDRAGRPIATSCFTTPIEFLTEPSSDARARAPGKLALAPPGARHFRATWLVFNKLDEGTWRFALDLFGPASSTVPVATRVVAHSAVRHARGVGWGFGLLALGSLVLLVLLPAVPGRPWQVAVLVLAALQGYAFARGQNPLVPRAESFPETRTEAILAEILGPHRFFSDRFVLPPNTGLVRGLRGLDGYDGMDVATYNGFRFLALPPGANGLLAWNARGVNLDSPAFRLFGVGALVMASPFEHPDWELVAAPGPPPGVEREAETWIYRALDPLPRAFCVPAVVDFDALADLFEAGTWDPLAVACLAEDWRPTRPFTTATVSDPEWSNNSVRLRAELDGEGLLVLTEQSFPGWTVTVDGEPRELLTADAIFRAVALGPGEHEVVFRYRPWSLRAGLALSAAAALVLGAFLILGLRVRPLESRP